MSTNKKNSDVKYQDYGHKEGAQSNTPPTRDSGQRSSDTQTHSMSSMMNESEEQKAGRDHDQKDETDVEQEGQS